MGRRINTCNTLGLLAAAMVLFNACSKKDDEVVSPSGTKFYAGTANGFSVTFTGGTVFQNRDKTNGLGSASIFDIVRKGSRLFVATAEGLGASQDDGVTFNNYTQELHGLGSNQINGLFVTDSLKIYAATNGGLSISNAGDSFETKTVAHGLGNNIVNEVVVVDDIIYAATVGGLSISTDGGASFVNRTVADGLGNNFVTAVLVQGTKVFLATEGGLSFSTDGGVGFGNRTTADGLPSDLVRDIFLTEDGILWLATPAGLALSADSGSTFSLRGTAHGLDSTDCTTIFVKNTTVYVGTIDGLNVSTNGGQDFTQHYTASEHKLGDDVIRAVVE